VSKRDHIRGEATIPVTLVQYGDYACACCGEAFTLVENIRTHLQNRLRFVFRHFPMTQSHPRAKYAAEAAEAAGAQDKFWEMHTNIFTHQQGLDEKDLMQYAMSLHLDTTRFRRDLALHRYAVRVREDFVSGIRSGVNGTPTFFINQARYDGPRNFDGLLTAIENANRIGHARTT
jgi:protein-disulfide isomerase